LKKFLLNLPVWRFSMESPAAVDLLVDTGIVRLLIVAQGWSMDWPVPEAELKEAVTDLREGRLQAAQVVLVDYMWKVRARAGVQRVVKNIGFCGARRGVFWLNSKFRVAVRCFPRAVKSSFDAEAI
jgi:hypothetical protein